MRVKTWFSIALVILIAGSVSATVVDDLKSSGVKGGLVVHLGSGDGTETVGLRLNERYVVQGLENSDESLAKSRVFIQSQGLYGPVSAYKYDGVKLPYVKNLVNVIVATGECQVSDAELLRVLAPRGVALVNGKKIVKPWPKELDEWNHYLHGPENNAVSQDEVSGNPRSVQWVSYPRWGRSHEELASMSGAVSANGRVFFIADMAPLASIRFDGEWELVARDAFNGTFLWNKQIPNWNDHLRHFRSGPVHLPRRLVAVGNEVYVTLGLDSPVTALDGATGELLRTYANTERTEEILCKDGVLYLVVGTSEIYRQGGGLYKRGEPAPTDFRYITAIEAESAKILWKSACPDGEYLLPLSLTVKNDKVFYQSTVGVVCLDAKTGDENWKTKRPTPAKRMSFSAPTVVATDEILLVADRQATSKDMANMKVEWGVHGWNEPGFPRKGKCLVRAYSVVDGKELWVAPGTEGYNSPVDIFVVGDTVWVGADFKGFDLKTGELKHSIKWKGPAVGMAHHRCYRDKASVNFLFTGRSGVEVVSLETGWLANNSWIRGTCQYGIMPANGFVYAPPDACACFPKVKVAGFFAAATQRDADGTMPFPAKPVLEKGPAYGNVQPGGGAGDAAWPTYRHDAARSGATDAQVPDSITKRWSVEIGGKLTQSVIGKGQLYMASTDQHTVHALSVKSGAEVWAYTAGGRVDSVPTLYKGFLLFGSADGWVYALRAKDGVLAWRFRAAPQDRLVNIFDQLESLWPVHGSVLVQNDTIYVTAGRSTYMDSGIVLYRLKPLTGEELSRKVLYDLDPTSGAQKAGEARFDMEGVASDLLSGDGDHVFLKHLPFTREGESSQEQRPHLFCMTGFLGEEWFVRSYWLIGTDVGAGWGGWADAANKTPAGRILCFNDDYIYGYGRKAVASAAVGHKLDAYHLFSKTKKMIATKPAPKGKKSAPKTPVAPKQAEMPDTWSHEGGLIVRSMVLVGDKMVVAGPPDAGVKDADILQFKNESEALASFKGETGVFLQVISCTDGKKLSEKKLDAMPVFDGMSAGGGNVFVSLKNGMVQCWGE